MDPVTIASLSVIGITFIAKVIMGVKRIHDRKKAEKEAKKNV